MKYLIFIFISLFIYGNNTWEEIKTTDFSSEDKRFLIEDTKEYETYIKNGKYWVEVKKKEVSKDVELKYSLNNKYENKISFDLERKSNRNYTFYGFKINLSSRWEVIVEADEEGNLYVYTYDPEDEETYYFKGEYPHYNKSGGNNFVIISNKDEIKISINDKPLATFNIDNLNYENFVFYSYGKIIYTVDNFSFYQRDYINKEDIKKEGNEVEEEIKEEIGEEFRNKNV